MGSFSLIHWGIVGLIVCLWVLCGAIAAAFLRKTGLKWTGVFALICFFSPLALLGLALVFRFFLGPPDTKTEERLALAKDQRVPIS
jgi:hypothetical protein